MPIYRPYDLYLSDEAYQRLVDQARTLGFVGGEINAKGFNKYVEFLMGCNMRDNRPEDITASDQEMLAAGYSPEWRLYVPIRRRRITLRQDTLVQATVHALELGIAFPPSRRVLRAPTISDGPQCLSVLLEAIGTDWIVVMVGDNDQGV